MSLFKNHNGKAQPIKEKTIKLEKDLQKFTEDNLETIFNLKLVKSEFQLNNLRIDSLAYDLENKSFVIIEYKRDKSFSVIDQGYAYLALMLNNKADFILEYNENNLKPIDRQNVDWTQSRVLFLANSFTTYQQNAINFKDLPIELWEVRNYDGDLYSYQKINAQDNVETVKTITKNAAIQKVNKEIEVATVENHTQNKPQEIVDLFEELSEKILQIDPRASRKAAKDYIGFQINNYNFAGIRIRRNYINIDLPRCLAKKLKDPQKIVTDRKNAMKFYNQNIAEFNLKPEDDIDYAIMLIKQSYKKLLETKDL